LATLYREVVVRFRPHTSQRTIDALLRRNGMAVKRHSPFVADQRVVSDPNYERAGVDLIGISNSLNDNDEVEFAAPNFVSEYTRAATIVPTANQWHLAAISVTGAWTKTTGRKTVVAVLDDGVDLAHPALRRRLWANPDKAARDRHGRDFFVRDTDPEHWSPAAKAGGPPWADMARNDLHGTQCAGLIGAVAPPGVAPSARILPVRVFSAGQMAADEQVADAIRYATLHADVVSCSWYGPQSADVNFALVDAQTGRAGRGVAAFFSAGNDSAAPIRYPAKDPNAIAVGAVTNANTRASYSNIGAELSIVAPGGDSLTGLLTTDLSAPGRGVNPGSPPADPDGRFTTGFQGTSAAAPIAAGVAALVIAANPDLDRTAVRGLLQDTATKIGPIAYVDSRNDEYGHGLVNAEAAVNAARAARPRTRRTPIV
jgi:subtilisin family serine protease